MGENRERIKEIIAHPDDPEPLVLEHAAWALGRIGSAEARQTLHEALERETHPQVLSEINLALGETAEPLPAEATLPGGVYGPAN